MNRRLALVLAVAAACTWYSRARVFGQEATSRPTASAAAEGTSPSTKASRRSIQTIPVWDVMNLPDTPPVARPPVWIDAEERLEVNRRLRREWGRDFEPLEQNYAFLASPESTGSKTLAEHLTHLARWREEMPGSAAARVVSAKALIRHAWEARGSGWASTVTEEGWKLFSTRIAEAHQLLDEALAIGVKDGEAYARLLNLAYAEGVPREVADRWLAAGMQIDPTYYSMYSEMAVYLMPRWGGQPGDIERFASEMAEKLPGDDGLEAFARIAFTIQRYECGWGETLVRGEYDPERLVKAAEVLLKRNPGSRSAQFAALSALITQDHEAAKRVRPLVGDYNQEDKIWAWQNSLQHFLDWSAAAECPRTEEHWVFAGLMGTPAIAFGTDDQHIWVAQQYGNAAAHLMNVKTGEIELSLPSPGGVTNGFVFDSARKWALSSSWRGPFMGWTLWDLSGTREPVAHETKEQCRTMTLHPREPIVFWAEGQTVLSWNFETETAGPQMEVGEAVHHLVVSPSGSLLIANHTSFDTKSGEVKAKLTPRPRQKAVNPYLQRPLAIEDDGRIWATAIAVASATQRKQQMSLVRYAADGQSSETIISELDATRGWLSPDCKLLATSGAIQNGPAVARIDLWNVETGQRLKQFAGHWNSIGEVVFAPGGERLASVATWADAVKTWSLAGLVED